ncbi:MAG TPA: thiamine pyrophosphate-dependent enzyme, partial [Limnochordales bacterium]
DVLEVEAAVRAMVERARAGEGPSLVELVTYRFRGHSMADPELYRSKEEVERWKAQDPIKRFRRQLQEEGHANEAELAAVEQEVEATVEDAVRFADESPEPDPNTLFDHVYVNP